ncbi:hypothetical protein [Aquihabitans sp. McL0605]|uniref:hypothetical protein n=1 Tax=Aquihabitans sp. McL0605 TaxID=3415671 RepID=UPI003CF60557
MSTLGIEPAEIDETLSMDLRVRSSAVSLKGTPAGPDSCAGCAFYLEPTADISYCWHPALRILVGSAWWCVCWESAEGA